MKIVHAIRAAATLVVLALAVGPQSAVAQDTGTVTGRVTNAEGQAAQDTRVRLVTAGRAVQVAENGTFRFENVPAGRHLIEASSARWGEAVARFELTEGGSEELEIELQLLFHIGGIVVSAGPRAQASDELYQPASVLTARDLARRAAPSLGETLEQEPGVTSSYFGPGAGRPIIRGLAGDRVRVLEGGVSVGDASSTSPDHNVSIDPLGASRIEVVRGPATLLYGSSAIGGVVNVFDNKIARELQPEPFVGNAVVLGGTAASEALISAEGNARAGSLMIHASGLRRDTDDVDIPGFAEAEHDDEGEEEEGEEEEAFGTLPNSFVQTTRFAAGASLVGDAGHLGVAFTGYDSRYGVPGHGHHEEEGEEEEEEEEEEGGPVIDMQQRRVDLDGMARFNSGFIESIEGRFGVTNYTHDELEGGGPEVGTTVTNDEWETRLAAKHREVGPFLGAFGVQFGNRELAAVGEEGFVPPNETSRFGAFLFEEFGSGPVRVQGAVRYETQSADAAGVATDVEHSGFSSSVGLNWRPRSEVAVFVNGARSVKLPSAEELFSNGPHPATQQFEVGSVDLEEEVGYTFDAGLAVESGRFNAEVSAFVNQFDNFIFQSFTNEEEDELPVVVYEQLDANFIGFEWLLGYALMERTNEHVHFEFTGDWVRAELADTDRPLPRIPPLELGAALSYESPEWNGRFGLRNVSEQDRVAEFEEETDGYTMLDAQVGYRLFFGGSVHEFIVTARNLTDEEARSHVSFLKEIAPLPGRDFRFTYRVTF